ncbi:hypothetical protein [Kordia sp.]|uniref:hypothetical protein n=1 Tax=Kordia sp. TaxID=1965332 RepID=UPI003B590094
MKYKTRQSHKIIAMFLLLNFLPSIVPINHLMASNNGPNAPEAASFEPVDATDMVNLATGDLSYVLPLLNVPSPEGGYPLALSYHAGIAMDQEASWVGLGWNLNPGAINRSVNGYPDDYNNALLSEYFYDEGREESIYSLSLGYSATGSYSAGLGFSWGSNRSLGGFVSIGYGPTEGLGGSLKLGTQGIGINVGYSSGVLSVGASASTNGGLSGSAGLNSNGTGFTVSTSGVIDVSIATGSGKNNTAALGISLSSHGVSVTGRATNRSSSTNEVQGGAGIGIHLQFENTISMGDYTAKTSGWQIPIMLPTKTGIFSLTFGKQKFRYYLGKSEYNYITGPNYFNTGVYDQGKWEVLVFRNYANFSTACPNLTLITSNYEEALNYKESFYGYNSCDCETSSHLPEDSDCVAIIKELSYDTAFMDIYEVSLQGNSLSNTSQNDIADNMIFPSYDKYDVQAQGLSGGISSRLFENGNLFGLTDKENDKGYSLKYSLDGSDTNLPSHAIFNNKPYFYFDNEISTYLGVTDVSEANFDAASINHTNILDYYANDGSVELSAKPRRKNGTYVDYYTIEELRENYASLKSEGFLLPESGFDINTENLPKDGIGAFKVTAVDGKTYHYSLPVYNHETITRTFGSINARPDQSQSYFEKRQLEPYATHWLLTAVTGPDYYDANNNGTADKEDYGYWTTFEYGKWSDAFVWKNPYGKEYHENETNSDVKTWIRGRKQVYYLDRVKTRTHSAIFIKSERHDANSTAWNYESVAHIDNLDQNSSNYQSRFSIPSQKTLCLDKVILVKESNDNLDKSYGNSSQNYTDIYYNDSSKPSEQGWYNLKNNVIDISDNWNGLLTNAVKVIDFNYDYSLAQGTPNTTSSFYGRLTLNSVEFKGKSATQLIPPYHFNYLKDNTYVYDIEDKDGFGYYKEDNSIWSLNEIVTPQGAKIRVNYEDHSIKSVVESNITFRKSASTYNIIKLSNTTFRVKADHDFGIEIGDVMNFTYSKDCFMEDPGNCGGPCGEDLIGSCEINQNAVVISDNGDNSYDIQISIPICEPDIDPADYCTRTKESYEASYVINEIIPNYGGIRVASIITTNDVDSYTTSYKYGENENGIGYISYLPFAPELEEELPYSAELPAPKVMYEYVVMESSQSEGKVQYKFKVFKEKEEDAIKFGDLYEVEVLSDEHYNSVSDKDVAINKYTVRDNLSTLGQLLEVSTINGRGHLLSKIENTYYSPEDPTPNNVGVTKEAYQTYKIVDYAQNTPDKKDKWLVNSSARIKYPSLLKYATEYKSGYQYRSLFGEIDEITGQTLEVLSVTSDGTEVKSKTIPAYYKYPQMGSKVDDPLNKNMLAQQAMSKTYIKADDGLWKETGVGITTWSNQWKYVTYDGALETPSSEEDVWRKHKNYVWEGTLNDDGTYNGFMGEDDNFDWSIGSWPLGTDQTNPKWKNISTITRYDHYSMPLEVKDINDNYAITKTTDNETKVLFTANAKYFEAFNTGAENYDNETSRLDPQIFGAASLRTTEKAHTGNYSLKITPSDNTFGAALTGIHRTGKYKMSVWVHKDTHENARFKKGSGVLEEFNGEKIIAGDWVQLNHYFDRFEAETFTSTVFKVASASGTIYVDDFRLHPIATTMTSYVYNEWDELSYMLDGNNMATHYEYDSNGRLIKTSVEYIDTATIPGGFKKVSEHNYHYKNN